MFTRHYVYLMLGCLTVVAGCSDPAPKTQPAAKVPEPPSVMAPFRYHKAIEVSPGQFYDIMSWGRGSDTTGAFQILRSDSAARQYTTTTGDLEGKIIDVYNADMDTDGNPEIFIQTQLTDSLHTARVFAFEYNDQRSRQLDFPKLTRSQRKGYHGDDNFFVRDGKLMREFVIYEDTDSTSKSTSQKRLIQYDLRGNEIRAEQLSKDSVNSSNAAQSSTAPVVTRSSGQKRSSNVSHSSRRRSSSVSRSSSRKRSSSKKTSSRRRRHRG